MKALYIYNPRSAPELVLIERAKAEMSTYIEVVSIDDCPDMIRRLVRATPALITAEDHLQGVELTADGVDGKLLITAKLNERLEEEELSIHQAQTHRLDNLINAEKSISKEEGREEIRAIVRGAAALPTLNQEAATELKNKGVLPQ